MRVPGTAPTWRGVPTGSKRCRPPRSMNWPRQAIPGWTNSATSRRSPSRISCCLQLARRLAATLDQLIDGCGFVLYRALPVEAWGRRRSAIVFYGLGMHLGNPVSQNAQGHVLGHVRDMGLSSDDPNVRIYQTRERQTFHTDSADVVGLLCLQTARSAGCRRWSRRRRSTTRCARAGPTWRRGCSSRLQPIAAARCRPARSRSSRSRCSTGTCRAAGPERCPLSTNANTSTPRNVSPTRRA